MATSRDNGPVVVLAVSKSGALISWGGAALFGVLTIAWSWLTPGRWRLAITLGRRLPKPLRSLYPPETDPRNEQSARRANSQLRWVGTAFVVVGTVGFIVRLAMR